MQIIEERVPSGQPLVEALIHDFSKVQHLYEYDLQDHSSWHKRLSWIHASEEHRVDRSKMVKVLREYNDRLNSHTAVSRSLDLLEQPETTVIVGGQQSGLLTGPLLVIYKALSIIKAAERATLELGHPVVPVFWIAGEDHDWEEVNHTYFLSSDLQVSSIRLTKEGSKRNAVSYTKVQPEEWLQIEQELQRLLPDSEFKAGLLGMFRQTAAESDTLTESFARLLGTWFGRYGLVLLDSADPKLRQLETPIFEQIIIRNDHLEQAYRQTAEDVIQFGSTPQADVAVGGANLFYINEGERLLLFKQEGMFVDRRQKVRFTMQQLLDELYRHPEKFSNNVLTRPIMQESLLPVLGTVLGNGEIAYWGLTGRAFRMLDLRMPILIPRESFTVVDRTTQKLMEKYGLSWEVVKDREEFEAKRELWLAQQDVWGVDEQFESVKKAFNELYSPLLEQLGQISKGLVKLGDVNRSKIIEQVDYLRAKAREALMRTNEVGLGHFERIQLSLFPQYKLQERVYNIFYYLNRYGESWIDDLMRIPYDGTGAHRTLYL